MSYFTGVQGFVPAGSSLAAVNPLAMGGSDYAGTPLSHYWKVTSVGTGQVDIVDALPAGTNQIGLVAQGTAAALSGYWPVGLSDGTNLIGVSAHPLLVAGTGTAGAPGTAVLTIQGIGSGTPVPVSGTVSIGSGPFTVVGNLTNNNAAPAATELGVLPALANAAAPTWTEGDQVLLSVDLSGNQRVLLHAETTKVIGTVRMTGNVGGVLDTTLGSAKPANLLQVGGNDGTNAYAIPLASGGASVVVSGTVSIGSGPFTVAGNLTNNNAAPSTNNIGALAVLANAAAPTWTEGDMVLLSSDLSGNLRTILHAETTKVIGTVRVTGNAGAAVDAVPGSAVPANAVQVGGSDGTNLRALNTDTLGNQKIRPAAPTTASWSQLPINVSALGANVIVPAVGGQTVRIMRMFFINCDPTTTVNVTIQDTTPTSFTGPMRYISTGNFNGVSGQGEPLYVSAVGKGIQLNTDAAVQLSGTVWYTQS